VPASNHRLEHHPITDLQTTDLVTHSGYFAGQFMA
jgi:hypothetical protein